MSDEPVRVVVRAYVDGRLVAAVDTVAVPSPADEPEDWDEPLADGTNVVQVGLWRTT